MRPAAPEVRRGEDSLSSLHVGTKELVFPWNLCAHRFFWVSTQTSSSAAPQTSSFGMLPGAPFFSSQGAVSTRSLLTYAADGLR